MNYDLFVFNAAVPLPARQRGIARRGIPQAAQRGGEFSARGDEPLSPSIGLELSPLY